MNDKKEYIDFTCIEVQQPIGTFYVGAMEAEDLIQISYADRRAIEEEGKDRYFGIQRQLSPSRVEELKSYVGFSDASFPTSIILAIRSTKLPSESSVVEGPDNGQLVSYDPATRIMKIRKEKDIAKIIDGQHRLAGLVGLQGGKFQLNVTVFVDMDIEDQAMVFTTVNLQQTKVNRSLAYDLFEYAKSRSPQRTCHDIAQLLNKRDGSPFRGRIKMLGTADRPGQMLTQAAIVDRLLPYLCWDRLEDRDLLKRGKKPDPAKGKDTEKYIFRDLFLKEQDAVIAKIMWNYFSVVKDKWTSAWDRQETGFILNRTTGFAALMRFLRPVYLNTSKDARGLVAEGEFRRVFDSINIAAEQFTSDNYKPGSSGEGALYHDFLEKSGLSTTI